MPLQHRRRVVELRAGQRPQEVYVGPVDPAVLWGERSMPIGPRGWCYYLDGRVLVREGGAAILDITCRFEEVTP